MVLGRGSRAASIPTAHTHPLIWNVRLRLWSGTTPPPLPGFGFTGSMMPNLALGNREGLGPCRGLVGLGSLVCSEAWCLLLSPPKPRGLDGCGRLCPDPCPPSCPGLTPTQDGRGEGGWGPPAQPARPDRTPAHGQSSEY